MKNSFLKTLVLGTVMLCIGMTNPDSAQADFSGRRGDNAADKILFKMAKLSRKNYLNYIDVTRDDGEGRLIINRDRYINQFGDCTPNGNTTYTYVNNQRVQCYLVRPFRVGELEITHDPSINELCIEGTLIPLYKQDGLWHRADEVPFFLCGNDKNKEEEQVDVGRIEEKFRHKINKTNQGIVGDQ